jgi:parallel beta-helix repeat protein
LDSSSDNNIRGNNLLSNNGNGVTILHSSNNELTHNNASFNSYGITLYDSPNNKLRENFLYWNNNEGIQLSQSSYNNLTGNNMISNNNGMEIWRSSNNNITNNNVSNHNSGISLFRSDFNLIMTNNVSSNNRGISISWDSSNNTIIDNTVSHNTYEGIEFSTSYNNTITGNKLSDNDIGIELLSSLNNTIKNNNISSSIFYGIYLGSSHLNNICGNNVSYGVEGIFLDSSNWNNITANTLKSIGSFGIILFDSIENNLTSNNMVETGIVILGDQIEHWNSHSIDTSNTVNGELVYYWKNQSGGIVPLDAGQVILANCTNVKVENQELTNVSVGLELGFSHNNTITNNTISSNNWDGIHLYLSYSNDLANNNISNNDYGIALDSSSLNNFTGNNISNNGYGFHLSYSSGNNIKNNTVSSNNWYGLDLYSSDGNFIIGNNITNNLNGIHLYISSFNEIYHNNFVDNDNEPYDNRDDNYWDNGYPSGGNYWSDWTTPDDYSGPGQDQSGSDGIVDNPKAVEGGSNQDHYPYTTESGWLNPPEVGPVHNIDTGEYFNTIQAAIDDTDTLDGHTITVAEGTYNENVVVNKTLTISGEDLFTTIIDGSGTGNVIRIIADWVNITGFTITNSDSSDSGIQVESDNNLVIRNNITNNGYGIHLDTSSDNTIMDNLITTNSLQGIYLQFSSNFNFIFANLISYNDAGVDIRESSNNNVVYYNWIISNDYNGVGITSTSSNNYLEGNNASLNGFSGISISFSSNYNQIIDNNVTGNAVSGIAVGFSSNTNISGNEIVDNPRGIELDTSSDNNITDNNITSNYEHGLYMIDSTNNIVYHNNFIENAIQAYQNTNIGNTWDDGYPSAGNYWSDWTSPDEFSGENQDETGSDGVVDNPRTVDGAFGQDLYPVTTLNGWPAVIELDPVHNIDTDEYFDTIQAAIDDPDTQDGHTIEVGAGIYVENVVIDKVLTLRGEDKNNTIIDGNLNGDVVAVSTDWVNITGFTITRSGSIDAGIDLTFFNNCSVFNNNISNNENGVILSSSHWNNIYENIISDNERGIYSYRSNVNNIDGNILFSNSIRSILLSESNGNDIIFNNVSNDVEGIVLDESNGNSVISNIILDNSNDGIGIYRSTGNIIIDNTMLENGIYLYGVQLEHWNSHTIENSNSVNGKPVYYWKNQTGGTIPAGAGQVILANCTNIQIENQKLNNCTIGIELGFSSNNTVIGNNISNNTKSYIYLWESHWNSLVNNTAYSSGDPHITSTGYGIYIIHSDGNDITGNLFWNASKGIWFSSSNWNNFTNNNVSNCIHGIDLQDSSSNKIYHNNIIDNNNQGEDDGSNNFWDNDYPSGGNYWSDYSGIDEYSGPDQNEPGSDGIGDTPYEIDINSHDNYPLMEPFVIDTTPPQIISGPTIISLSATGATIVWETNELSDSEVEYGLTTIYDTIVVNSTYDTNHNISLTGLEPNTQYHYRVISKDHAGNEVVSGDFTFTTSSPKSVHNLDKNLYYDAIQEAIDDADSSNTIFVSNGIYYENVWVDKSINLTGENRDSTIINGSGNGNVLMITSDWVNITGFTITSGSLGDDTGIGLDSSYCIVSDNNIIFNNDYGIYFYPSSKGNIIINNNISSNSYGAMRLYDRGNNITGNIISSNGQFGIFLDSSSGNNVTDNIISLNNRIGLYLYHSTENTITGNTMIQDGIFILGDQIEHWNSHLIDTTNTVNDKPVYYWKNQNNGVIPGSAGQVILANCTDIRIVDQELTEGSVGILLGFSSYNNIINNNISGNYIGIFLCHSNANNITNNNASFNDRDGIYLESSAYNDIIKNTALSNNEYGIYLTYSPENNLIENIVNSNTERGILLGYSNLNSILNNTVNLNNLYGIYLHSSNENAISNNTVIRNINYGIYFQGSSNNHIYHNNFSNNTNQAYDDSDDNNWDNGYPSGGNYWSDYTGIDEYSGPNQNEEGSDGLGDTPYTNIQGGAGARDNYPLVEDIYPPTIQLISPFNNSVIKKGTLINLSISDPNLNQVTYSKNNGPDQALIFPYEINTTGWPDDNYIIEIRATDTLNNENIEWYNFTIDSTPPSITLNSPDNNSYIIWNVEINLTISDDNLDQVSYIKDDENAKSLSYPLYY